MTPRMPLEQLGFARKLRREMSTAEAMLWRGLRGRGVDAKFRRQMPIGGYVADFACVEAKLIVEIDGPAHADVDRQRRDEHRDAWLAKQGWRILRFSDGAVMGGSELVIAEIKREMSRRPSSDPR